MTKRSLLIGGGSEPRNTVSFENCQFINNARTETSPFVSSINGVFSVISEFVDVTISDSLFEDNNYPFIYDGPVSGNSTWLLLQSDKFSHLFRFYCRQVDILLTLKRVQH